MSVQKSSIGVFASIAGAVVSFCTAFIRSMTVVEDAVGMAEASVKSAREKQAIDLEIEQDEYAKRKINEATIRLSKSDDAVVEYANKDQAKLDQLNKLRTDLQNKVNKRLTSLHHNAE